MCPEQSEIFIKAAKLFGYSLEGDVDPALPSDSDIEHWQVPVLEDSILIMLEFMSHSTNEQLIIEALISLSESLGAYNSGIALRLRSLIDSDSEEVRRTLVGVLEQIKDNDSIDLLVLLHQDESAIVRASVAKALAGLPTEKIFVKSVNEALVWLIDDMDEIISSTAVHGLLRIHAPEVYGHLRTIILNDELSSEYFDLIESYGPMKLKNELIELYNSLRHSQVYESRSQWWKDSFEELIKFRRWSKLIFYRLRLE